MTKVALLGDSIRLGYGKKVIGYLDEDFEVFQPADNCRFTDYTRRLIWVERENIEGSDVIHWNNGAWDACDLFGDGPFYTPQEYGDNLEKIAKILQKMGKTIIFATSTPIRDVNERDKNENIIEFNKVAVERLAPMGIIINDLNALISADIDKYVSEDGIHLTEEGYDACAQQVADYIEKYSK